jgi:hypothetical protein
LSSVGETCDLEVARGLSPSSRATAAAEPRFRQLELRGQAFTNRTSAMLCARGLLSRASARRKGRDGLLELRDRLTRIQRRELARVCCRACLASVTLDLATTFSP